MDSVEAMTVLAYILVLLLLAAVNFASICLEKSSSGPRKFY